MTLHLARVLAPEVRVNAVCPGLITSRWFVQGVGQEGADKLAANYERNAPLARACHAGGRRRRHRLAGGGGGTTTGELLRVDAGMHLGGIRSR